MSKQPTNIIFSKSENKNKKYKVKFDFKGKTYIRHFGDSNYEQFRDSTPLQLYRHLNHSDPKRRESYFKRHGLTNNPLSAKYWSNKYLW